MDRGLTQHQVSKILKVNRNFVYEVELNRRTNTIYALNKISIFLGYIPKTLSIDENTIQGKLITYRIWKGKTFLQLGKEIGLEKSTIIRFIQHKKCNHKSISKILTFITEFDQFNSF